MEETPRINRKISANMLKNEKIRFQLKIILEQPLEDFKREAAQGLYDKLDEDKTWLPKAKDLKKVLKILSKKPKKEKIY